MAHGGPTGTMWPDPATLTTDPTLSIPAPLMVGIKTEAMPPNPVGHSGAPMPIVIGPGGASGGGGSGLIHRQAQQQQHVQLQGQQLMGGITLKQEAFAPGDVGGGHVAFSAPAPAPMPHHHAAPSGGASGVRHLTGSAMGGAGAGAGIGMGDGGPAGDAETAEAEAVDPEAIYGQVFSDFVQSLDEFTPTIPDAVTSYYMSSAGFQVDDPRLLRLISLSCQKFIADVTNDAMQHCKIRMAQQLKNQKQTKPRFQLTLEDLLPTLKERGINIKKPHYFI